MNSYYLKLLLLLRALSRSLLLLYLCSKHQNSLVKPKPNTFLVRDKKKTAHMARKNHSHFQLLLCDFLFWLFLRLAC